MLTYKFFCQASRSRWITSDIELQAVFFHTLILKKKSFVTKYIVFVYKPIKAKYNSRNLRFVANKKSRLYKQETKRRSQFNIKYV